MRSGRRTLARAAPVMTAVALLPGAALPLGCGGDCTSYGCVDGVAFMFRDGLLPSSAAAPLRADVCFGGRCDSFTGTPRELREVLAYDFLNGGSVDGAPLDPEREYEATLRVADATGRTIVRAEREVRPTREEGDWCTPECTEARVVFTRADVLGG